MPLTPEALQAIRDRWTGNRVLDLRDIPLIDLDEAEEEHDRESSRRYERSERARHGLR
jgi:hypothetical protein